MMLRRKSLIFFALVFAIAVLFTATQAGADNGLTCTPGEAKEFLCFESNDHVVKMSRSYDGKETTFTYNMECGPPKIEDVLALFRVCDPELVISETASSPTITDFKLFPAGKGDSYGSGVKTRFGIAQEFFQAAQWEGFRSTSGSVSVTLMGEVGTEPGPVLLQITNNPAKWAYGNILLPACKITRPGTSLFRVIPLDDKNCIKVFLDPGTLCADTVEWYRNATCTGTHEVIPEEEDPEPTAIFSGTGNQFCPEGFRVIDVPGFSPCYEYCSGGRTRYIPKGCKGN